MTESVLLARHLKLTEVTVEVFQSPDGQGKPTYATGVAINVRAQRKSRVVVQTDGVGLSPGTKLAIDLTLLIPPGEAVYPNYQDRITHDGMYFIVVDVADVNDREGNRVFRRVGCQRGPKA